MELLCQIRELYRSVAALEVEMENRFHLCLNEGMVLCTLSEKEPLTSGELAEALQLTCSNTSKVIREVEKKGYIKRVLGEQDKRQMYFRLTPEGRKALSEVRSAQFGLPDALKNYLALVNK